eukprot:TRINITY_DN25425_c0_g1_i1.p1 TRINITY_DN25425_c0_g1~~TRINITY_DN25425_c0_g1_i1.p1  ORF type:complete len:904 (-),score=134.55 TRINITY_DN25425_c0_g1_i1:78-2789(-)
MGRYSRELGALARDPAGKYLDVARQRRKDLNAQSSPARRSAEVETANWDAEWQPVNLSAVALEAGSSVEKVAAKLLQALPLGGRLAFKGAGKEERAMIHDLAHRLPGLWKNSYADPDSGDGARMVCVERVKCAQAGLPATGSTQAASLARPPPPPVPESLSVTQPQPGASSGSHQTLMMEPRKNRWRRSLVPSHDMPTGMKQEPDTEVSLDRNDGQLPWSTANRQGENSIQPSIVQAGSVACVGSVCVVWLRDDMRLLDNPALLHAAEGNFDAVIPVYIYAKDDSDPHALNGAAMIWKHESLQVFAATLAAKSSRLVLRHANAGNVAGELLDLLSELDTPAYNTDKRGSGSSTPRRLVVFNRRCEPYYHARDEEVVSAIKAAGVEVETFTGNVLYEPQDLQPIERWQHWRARVRAEEAQSRGLKVEEAAQALSGKPKALEHISGFGSYRFFSHALEELGPPRRPCAVVRRLPPCPSVRSCSLKSLGLGKSAGRGFPCDFRQCSSAAESGDWAQELRRAWSFGEEAALQRLSDFLNHVLAAGDFEGRKRLLCDQRNTSELSPYIRFGELSARTVYWEAKQRRERTNQKLFEKAEYEYVSRHGSTFKGNPNEAAKANSTFLRRFVWRDLAYWFLWEFPSLPETSLRPQYEEEIWTGTRRQLRHWQRGTTGFPLVDAAMRQLWAVGWMPNYLRHVVAQTLIEYLDISWKDGLKWFDYTLVDMDVAINSFMWQNGGHSGPDHWEFVLHPINAAKTCDPDGNYVRRWLPFLAGCPTEFIHCPWEAPVRLFRFPAPDQGYPCKALISDLDEARRNHFRRVLQVRRNHPEMISRTGHEWLKLPGRGGLLAKCVTRQEFRAETEDFIFFQGPRQKQATVKRAAPSRNDHFGSVLCESMKRYETEDAQGPGL